MNNITIVGSGYVGLSLATLLAVQNNVKILDIDKRRVDSINNLIPPLNDDYIEMYFNEKSLNINATLDKEHAYNDASYIIVATPTNYNEENNYFDTSSVDEVIEEAISFNSEALIVIKSTVPMGYTSHVQEKFKSENIVFSPEFLREGSALYDNLYPSRIIIGSETEEAKSFVDILIESSLKKEINALYMKSTEAEAVKLFANTYLAMRISFFNEVDTYSLEKGLNAKNIIDGICLDERIGNHYNNPSFGYGGYCLPKDTKQLLSDYDNVPQNIIQAIVDSNKTRKNYIASNLLKDNPKVVGVYRLIMKSSSDNFRESAIHDVISSLKESNVDVIIFEPLLSDDFYTNNVRVIKDLQQFKELSDIIITNRFSEELQDVFHKVYTRDIYNNN